MRFILFLALAAGIGFSPLSAKKKLNVYLVTNPSYAGDTGAIQAIGAAITRKNPRTNLVTLSTQSSKKLDASAPCAVITINKYGGAFITQNPTPKCMRVNISHQAADYMHTTLEKFDLLALPAHTELPLALQKAKLKIVRTPGMPHLVTRDTLTQQLKDHAIALPDLPKGDLYLVMLGGDAPRPDGSVMPFKTDDINVILEHLRKMKGMRNAAVWIFNGPRTGKYKHGKEVKNAHRNPKLDHVTQKAVDAFESIGFHKGKNLTIFNFEFGKPSLYKAALGHLLSKSGTLFLPGESVSMVSEAHDVSELSTKTVIYFTSSMNKEHVAFVKSDPRFKILNTKNSPLPSSANQHQRVSAAESIADEILMHPKLRGTYAKTH